MHRRTTLAARATQKSLFGVDPFLQIRPMPNEDFHVNADSFRGDPIEAGDDVFRVFALGGSTTFEWRLPYIETYPAKLERKLRAYFPGLKIQVQNAACDWYSSAHSLIRYELHVRHFRPDVIIVLDGINDLVRGFAPEWFSANGSTFRSDYSHYLGPVVRLDGQREEAYFPFQRLLLPTLLGFPRQRDPIVGVLDPEASDGISRAKALQQSVSIREWKSLPTFRENLSLLVRAARRDSTHVILATQPSVYGGELSEQESSNLYFGPFLCGEKGVYPDIESLERGMREFNAATVAVAEQENASVVDLAGLVPRDSVHFRDDVHVTEQTTEIEAVALLEEILRLRLVETKFPDVQRASRPLTRTMEVLVMDSQSLGVEIQDQTTRATGGSKTGSAAVSARFHTPFWGMTLRSERGGVLSRADLILKSVGHLDGQYQLSVYRTEHGIPVEHPLAQEALDIRTLTSGESSSISVAFHKPVVLPPGQGYALVLSALNEVSDVNHESFLTWEGSDDTYPSGTNFYSTDGIHWTRHSRDLGVTTYVRPILEK